MFIILFLLFLCFLKFNNFPTSTANMLFYQLYLVVLRRRLGCKKELQARTKYLRKTLVFM